jgi:hypothetical protein
MEAYADREFEGIRVVTADWPIVLTEFPQSRVADQSLGAVLRYLESLMIEATEDEEKLFFVTDLTVVREVTTASQRHLTADWLKRVTPLSLAASVGGAQVIPSTLLRGALSVLYWVQPPPTPTFCVRTREVAMLKGIEMLQAAKVLLSPRLVAYRDKMVRGGSAAPGGP